MTTKKKTRTVTVPTYRTLRFPKLELTVTERRYIEESGGRASFEGHLEKVAKDWFGKEIAKPAATWVREKEAEDAKEKASRKIDAARKAFEKSEAEAIERRKKLTELEEQLAG